MRVVGLALGALLLLVAPTKAAEYQGKNIDGMKLAGKAYFSETGGVYDVQVLFNRNRATIYFANGDQTTIKLRQQAITSPSNIEGVGRLAGYDLGGPFSIGLASGDTGKPLQGFWRISLSDPRLSNLGHN